MEKIVERSMLYDFYGELLTEHQRQVYEQVIFQDLSLGEAADIYGISRQGVHDLIKRCDKLLSQYEERLHLVERFLSLKTSVSRMHELMSDFARESGSKLPEQIEVVYREILKEL